jgi:hypothetical protein
MSNHSLNQATWRKHQLAALLLLAGAAAMGPSEVCAQSSHPTVWTPASNHSSSVRTGAGKVGTASTPQTPPSAQAIQASAADLKFDKSKLPPWHIEDNSHPGGPYFQAEVNLEIIRRNQRTAQELLRPLIPASKAYGETDPDFLARQKSAREKVETILAPYRTEISKLELLMETLAPSVTSSKLLKQTLKQEHFTKAEERYQQAAKRLEDAEKAAPPIPKQRGYGESESTFQARLKSVMAQREELLGKLRKARDEAEQQLNEANHL